MVSWLLQQGSGDCAKLLDVSAPLHRDHCERLGIVYVPRYQKIDPAPFSVNSENQVVFAKALRGELIEIPVQHGDIVFLLDADALWNGEDIRDVLPENADMALHVGRGYCNCGVIVLRVNQKTHELWSAVLEKGPARENNTLIDVRLLEEISSRKIKVSALPDEWNWFPREGLKCHREDAKILHYQGQHKDNVLLTMRDDVTRLAKVEHGEPSYTD